MRGKAEELQEEVDASLSKLLSAKRSRRYTHAMHHDARAMRKHAAHDTVLAPQLPLVLGGGLRRGGGCHVLTAVKRVLGVSFDPSTYGTGTNPVVADFLAELLHDSYPMAA
eukprot:jgi/Tetstr1/426733/TSEL_001670.t1